MSKTQDGFLGKVSKGIKKSIYDDEPDAASGKLIIERLQSLAGSVSPGQSKKIVEQMPNTVDAVNPQDPPAATAPASSATPPGDAAYRVGEIVAHPAATPEQNQVASPAGESPISENNPDPIRTSGPMATILVVEDEIVTQRLTRKILEERGYEVVVAEDGVDALMALGKINFDRILCDINMPNLDGFKLVEFLNAKNIFIPIIFITTREDVEDEIRGLALGAKDYIRKPVNRDLLLLRIRKALNK
jgi:CheY-like chemotaxis protein